MRIAFLLCMLVIAFSCEISANALHCADPVITDGVADLRCWDGLSVITLDGDWQFEYKAHEEDVRYQGFATVPGRWRFMEPALPYLGRGTYTLEMRLDEPVEALGLILSRSDLTRKLILKRNNNPDRVLYDSGNTDLAKAENIRMYNEVIFLPEIGEGDKLIMHVNNRRSVHGGIDSITVGPMNALVLKSSRGDNITMVIVSVLGIFFFFNIYVWYARNRSVTDLSLAGMAFAVCLRQLNVSGLLYDFFPSLTSVFNSAIGWGSYFSGMILGTIYLKSKFPKMIPSWLCSLIYIVTAIGMVIYIFQPLYVVQMYADFYRPASLILTISLVIFLFLGLRHVGKKSTLTIFSFLVLLIAFSLDVLYFQLFEAYSLISISSIGMLLFVGIETIDISKKYWNSIHQTAYLASELKELNANLENKVKEALSEIDVLRGSLPICASCKKIRDDKGYWSQIETYISENSEAEFSHGICPDCVHTLYPDMYENMYPDQEDENSDK